jgi:hypothetical protein
VRVHRCTRRRSGLPAKRPLRGSGPWPRRLLLTWLPDLRWAPHQSVQVAGTARCDDHSRGALPIIKRGRAERQHRRSDPGRHCPAPSTTTAAGRGARQGRRTRHLRPCSLRADRHLVGELAGEESMRAAAVQAGLVDRFAVGVGPVHAVGIDRYPGGAALAADDGLDGAAAKVAGTSDRAVGAAAGVGPVDVEAALRAAELQPPARRPVPDWSPLHQGSRHPAHRSSILVALDVHPRVAMQILHHSQIAITMEIYSEVPTAKTRSALKRLGKKLDG